MNHPRHYSRKITTEKKITIKKYMLRDRGNQSRIVWVNSLASGILVNFPTCLNV